MGTPQYMAPEQVAGKVDVRSDVWGLGVTLYEMLSLRRAFEGGTAAEVFEQVLTREAGSPRRWVGNAPADLIAVCRKAMRKEPGVRYATAGALSEDLRRWLRGEVVESRGAQPIRQVSRWARRNPGWAAALVVTALLLGGMASFAFAFQRQQAWNFAREARRFRLQQALQDNRRAGWSAEAWRLVEEEAALGLDARLQGLAAATLQGLDIHRVRTFEGLEASSVAFDAEGGRIVFGGLEDRRACWWDGTSAEPHPLHGTGLGPVTFSDDGTPLRLVVDVTDHRRLELWGAGSWPLQAFIMPEGIVAQERQDRPPIAILTPGGKFVAAAGEKQVAVWEVRTGRLLHKQSVTAKALAMTPDGSLLALGGQAGEIKVVHLPSGQVHAELRGEGTEVTCLTFYPSLLRAAGEKVSRWGLVAGDVSARVVVWDLARGQPCAFCNGSQVVIGSVAVSPDRMTLASTSGGTVYLWDLATGSPLLTFGAAEHVFGIAFSPDGRRLTVAGRSIFVKKPGSSHVWQVEQGRGLQVLRGLSAAVSTLALSADDRMLATLGRDWRICIWDLNSGEPRYLFDVPPGMSADNAGIDFGPDNTLAYSAGTKARVYKLEQDGVKELAKWQLNPGLVDRFARPLPDRLLLARMETKKGTWGPAETHPRIIHVMELKPVQDPRTLRILEAFPVRVFGMRITPDGSFLVAAGRNGQGEEQKACVAFNLLDGGEAWRWPESVEGETASISTDNDVNVLVWPEWSSKGLKHIIDVRSRKILASLPDIGGGPVISSNPKWHVATQLPVGEETSSGIALYRPGIIAPVLTVYLKPGYSLGDARFDRSGNRLIWRNDDGSVNVCNLQQVRDRLSKLGMGWAEH
jgi:WD40 repeat protein